VDGKFTAGDFSGQKPIIYIIQVEYQHRGLPHAHIVYRIGAEKKPATKIQSNPELEARRAKTILYIDGYTENDVEYLPHITAYRPGKIIGNESDFTPDKIAQNILDDSVGENQLHTHAVAVNGCKQSATDICKNGIDSFVPNLGTTFNEHGRPVYWKKLMRDVLVVGHNPSILLDWKAHCNTESVASENGILYLFDYISKGK
jgi:hypothetical protein